MSYCEFEQKVHAYHDGELPSDERQALEGHLKSCADCARELDELRGISRLFSSAQMPDLSARALKRLHDGARPVRELVLVRTSEYVASAAAVVLLTCAALLWRAQPADSSDRTLPAWEEPAVTLNVETPATGDAESTVTRWIVADLTQGRTR